MKNGEKNDIYQCENTDRTNGGNFTLVFLTYFWAKYSRNESESG